MMVDFSKWVSDWGKYAPWRYVPLSEGDQNLRYLLFLILSALVFLAYLKLDGDFGEHKGVCVLMTVVYFVAAIALIAPVLTGTRVETKEVPPPVLSAQLEKDYGIGSLTCLTGTGERLDLDLEGGLPDQGTYSCTYLDAKGTLRNVTLLSADGTKLGLYDTDGKALKPAGKE